VRKLIAGVSACDQTEHQQRADALAWIDSGAPLFRIMPPADPPRHLAVYFALFDEADHSVLMVDHRKARAWLLPGGHVDPGEDPRMTVVREADEELGCIAKFHDVTGDEPLFLSATQTRGAGSHTDVTLWFLLQADRREQYTVDLNEFHDTRWISLVDTDWSADCFDPAMGRFARKVRAALANVRNSRLPCSDARSAGAGTSTSTNCRLSRREIYGSNQG
jgi:8-oxo-dGTP pyrophosphatase MutT (NUDIX family)